jgi:hypothetical protein
MTECVYRWGLDWRLDLLTTYNTRLVTTLNYSAIANLHTLQITTAHTEHSQSASTSRFPVMDLNNGDSSASVFASLLSGEYPTTQLSSKLHPAYNPSAMTNTKHSSSIVACVCWDSHVITTQPVYWRAGSCLATAVVSLFVSRYFPSKHERAVRSYHKCTSSP